MKTLQNNFTTPAQSKRLKKLGIPDWTADCELNNDEWAKDGGVDFGRRIFVRHPGRPNDFRGLPCWSVGRLIEIFLKCSPYKDIAINESNIIEQMIESIFMVNKDGLLDFSKLEN